MSAPDFEKIAREIVNCSDETRMQRVRAYYLAPEQIEVALRAAYKAGQRDAREAAIADVRASSAMFRGAHVNANEALSDVITRIKARGGSNG